VLQTNDRRGPEVARTLGEQGSRTRRCSRRSPTVALWAPLVIAAERRRWADSERKVIPGTHLRTLHSIPSSFVDTVAMTSDDPYTKDELVRPDIGNWPDRGTRCARCKVLVPRFAALSLPNPPNRLALFTNAATA
jgi:hypothetical protein